MSIYHSDARCQAPAEDFPSLRQTLPVWVRVALYSFGGPAGQIAVMQRLLNVNHQKNARYRMTFTVHTMCTRNARGASGPP